MAKKQESFTMFAYGTNISQQEMKKHTEDAVFIGYGELPNYALRFRGFINHGIATLEKKKGASVKIAIYDLPTKARFTIDNSEQFPYAYKKEEVKGFLNGKLIKGYIYVLKLKLQPQLPNNQYLRDLRLAYFEANFDDEAINDAIVECGGEANQGDIFQ